MKVPSSSNATRTFRIWELGASLFFISCALLILFCVHLEKHPEIRILDSYVLLITAAPVVLLTSFNLATTSWQFAVLFICYHGVCGFFVGHLISSGSLRRSYLSATFGSGLVLLLASTVTWFVYDAITR